MASLVPRLAPGSVFAERFRILEIGRKVRSPHVAATLDAGKLSDRLGWLAMEFAPGVGFDEAAKAGAALSPEAARRLLEQLFQAVAAAHAVGVVHRDLKPENLRVAELAGGPSLKVLDFGIAKSLGPSTLSGTTPGLGTPLWTAPELARAGESPAPSADVWSLGLLAFFALSGRLYWEHAGEHASVADLAIELLRSEIVPPTQRLRELGSGRVLPATFDVWFGRAVHRDPAVRFRDASEAWAALRPVLMSVSMPATDDDALPPNADTPADRPAPVVRPGPFVTAVILSCVAAGLVIYWLLRSMHI